MVAIHLIFDLTELYPVLNWEYPPIFSFLMNWGGIAFFLISGICVTLGRHHLRRGVVVFGCGMLISAVTVLINAMPIRFGVLHCLGLCMLLWHLFRRICAKALCIIGIALSVLGLLFGFYTVSVPYLYPLGLISPGFESADFFPLLPYFGYFLLGAAFGKRYYKSRKSLFSNFPALPFFRFCGRHTLLIYLIHQPVLIVVIEAVLA